MPKTMTRRSFIKASALGFGSALVTGSLNSVAQGHSARMEGDFLHGVASGDPLHDAVIIWTRFTPVGIDPVSIRWEVAQDKSFSHIVAQGIVPTGAEQDYTAKIDVRDLQTDTRYFYRFHCQDKTSAIGETRTLPLLDPEKLTLAAVSCANYPSGFFHIYQEIAERTDIDFVLHLGDYIYEYGANGYATGKAKQLGRIPEPAHECLTRDDYRKRYQQYRSDLQLQLLHQKKPVIAVWDDHEVADDAWQTGASNHQDHEGDYFARRRAALQAYFEWMPIRPTDPIYKIYRRFQFGSLVDLFMLETRHTGRDKALSYSKYIFRKGIFDNDAFQKDVWDQNRSLLGIEQREWLFNGLYDSNARWQVLGQQVVMNQMHLPLPVILGELAIEQYYRLIDAFQLQQRSRQGLLLSPQQQDWLGTQKHLLTEENMQILSMPRVPYNLDAWDGYAAERYMLLETARHNNNNLVVLSGDSHNAWGGRLVSSPKHTKVSGYEFATPSVSSPGLEGYLNLNDWIARWLERQIKSQVDSLDFVNIRHRGFLTVTFTQETTNAQWNLTKDIHQPEFAQCRFTQQGIQVQHREQGGYKNAPKIRKGVVMTKDL